MLRFLGRSAVFVVVLLLLSEALEKYAQPVVITQIKKDFHANLKAASRGNGIFFATLPSITNSSSRIFLRVLELLLFTIFVFFSLSVYFAICVIWKNKKKKRR